MVRTGRKGSIFHGCWFSVSRTWGPRDQTKTIMLFCVSQAPSPDELYSWPCYLISGFASRARQVVSQSSQSSFFTF